MNLNTLQKRLNFDNQVDYVISSPLVRAQETAEIVTKHLLVKKNKIIVWNELKSESNILDIHKKLLKLRKLFKSMAS
ncbi:MAG: hypothetical protein COV65_04800 [Nitrosopumilales archaeon CG11_big_fil_rev_8_21_14_0_20_33_24]|nr:MAG: hypothetical protein COV65_04800 [Nitrosopumilales archaeon CG11_big_fil_rev_8_21_14_0_20_33_24]